MTATQKFGGVWTEEKLNIFTSYLDSYLVALSNQKFKKVYIDAFAGTGEIETNDEGQYLAGSAKLALEAKEKFDFYYFIEKDEGKASELQTMIDTDFVYLKKRVRVYCGDANQKLEHIVNEIDWRYNRGLLFLDPYSTQVNWSTLEIVAKSHAIDVWYLFPFSALNRMLPRKGVFSTWEQCIDRLLGDSNWRTEFYREDPQMTLIDICHDIDNMGEDDRKIKDANPEHIKSYIITRLQSVFPCVSKNPRIFRNSKNSPMFLFCFAISNDSPKAQSLALRIADHILKNK